MRAALLVLVFAVACGGAKEPKSPSDNVDDDDSPGARPSRGNGGPNIESEIGALDENAVKDVFKQARSKVTKCLRDANDGMDMEIVGGELEVQLRVKGDGKLRWVYPMRSTIGDRDAEKCVLRVLSSHTWPEPEGGDEGLARTDYSIDPPGRAPVDWSPSDLGDKAAAVKGHLRGCMKEAGASSLSVTMYVDADGNVVKAGGAVGDENGIDAIDCGVDAVKRIKFPSPGSYPAKVTVSVN